jgi:hypothetical protein
VNPRNGHHQPGLAALPAVEWTGWPPVETVEAGPAGEIPSDDETMIWARFWIAGHQHLPAPRAGDWR